MNTRRSHFLALFLVLLSVGLAAGAATAPQRLVVLSYNIQHGKGMDEKINLERQAAVIRSVSPDLVALQEVDRKVRRSGSVDQAQELARLTGLKMAFGRTMSLEGGDYGIAVLSRVPITTSTTRALPFTKGREPRVVLIVDLALTTPPVEQASSPFSLLATHFDFSPDSTDRLAAVSSIAQWIAAHPDRPALLAGDLNSTPDSPALKALSEKWQSVGAGRHLPTSPVGNPTRQIDHILYRPADRWRVVEARVLNEPMASDHRPILAVLELLPPRPAR